MTSSPEWVSPLVCVPKKNGDVRFCVDMRNANTAIIRNYYPIPTLDEILYEVNGAKIPGKLDLPQGYHQIVLDEKSRNITTFSAHQGLFRYKLGMSSLFINLILKTLHYFHMKVLNETSSKWVHLSFYHKRFSRYLHLKFKKEVIFVGRFSPYEIPKSGDKISNF